MKKLFFSLLLCSSCATRYTGPNPDLSKKGADAQAEIEKFTLKESIWTGRYYKMGPEETRYYYLNPVIASVSSRATDAMVSGHKWHSVGTAMFWMSMGFYFAAIFSKERYNYQPLYWTAAGLYTGALGISFVGNSKYKSAAKMYNEDLRTKLAPTLGVSFKF